jgi:hypothetical protein
MAVCLHVIYVVGPGVATSNVWEWDGMVWQEWDRLEGRTMQQGRHVIL